jgi:hypothetical protein
LRFGSRGAPGAAHGDVGGDSSLAECPVRLNVRFVIR